MEKEEFIASKDAVATVDEDIIEESTDDEPLTERQAIADKYNARKKEELGIEDPEEEPVEKESASKEPEQIEVTINGKARMVDKTKVDAAGGIENYQKNIAANMRLHEAAEERKRIAQEREELQQLKQQLEQERLQMAHSKPVQSETPPTGESNSLVKQYHEALFEGDDERASQLFEQLNAAQKATVDIEQIKREAAQEARQALQYDMQASAHQQTQAEINQANAEFEVNFPELVEDSYLYKLTNQRTVDLLNQHPDWRPSQIIEQAAKDVLQWKHDQVSASGADKKQSKRMIGSVKSGSGRAQATPQPKPMTNAEYIASLRQQRGLE